MLFRRARVRTVLLACALSAGVATPARAATPVGRLTPGRAVFWTATQGRLVTPEFDSEFREFALDVRGRAWRLRASFTNADFRRDVYGTLIAPSGKHYRMDGLQDGEAYVLDPMPGRWTIRISTGTRSYTDFKVRAKLEARAPARPRTKTALLPNLRLVPPYEFTFHASVSGGRGIAEIGSGASPGSCNADDTAEHAGVSCLRFSLGPSNVGAGPLVMEFPGGEGYTQATPGHSFQRILWSDGTTTTRAAGEFVYHYTHQHYHHNGFGTLTIFHVTDARTGQMTQVGVGPKQGFCTGDVMIADWAVFGEGKQNSAPSTCVETYYTQGAFDPREGTTMGLSAGWSDLYSWEQDGNYVDWAPTNPDGLYVVRSTADARNDVLESDETDNTGYAYIRVTGRTIEVLERGRGMSPWDPRKVVVRDGLHPVPRT